MALRSLLTAAERGQILAMPTGTEDLAAYYTLSDADMSLIRQRRGEANRLGFVVQLCLLRHPGIALAEDTEVLITGIALVDLMLGASLAVSVDIKGFDSDRFDDLTVSYRDGQRGSYGDLHISNAPMAGGRISIDISGSVPAVQGLPEGMQLYHGHRPWMTELVEQADSDERLNERLPARQPSVELIPGPRSRPR